MLMGFLGLFLGVAEVPAAGPEGLLGIVLAYVVPPAVTVLCSLAGLALVRLGQWLRTKTQNEAVAAIEERVLGAAAVAVRDVEQRVRKTIALTTADGRVTREEAARLRQEALTAAREHLGGLGWEQLLALHGGSEGAAQGYLGRAIEAEVHDLPKGGRALGGATAPQNPVGTA